MATTSTVGTTGRNYSTWQAGHDAFTTGGWILEGYNDTEFVITTVQSLTGKSTTITDFLTLRPATGQGFADYMNSHPGTPLRYDGGVSRSSGVGGTGVAVRTATASTTVFSVGEAYTTVTGMQFYRQNSDASVYAIDFGTSGQTNIIVGESIIEGDGGYGTLHAGNAATTPPLVRNGLIAARGGAAAAIYPQSDIRFANCSLVIPSDVTSTQSCIFTDATITVTMTNCAMFGFSSLTTGAGLTLTGSNNASDLAISFGTNNQASKTYANQFVTTTDTARDFTPLITGNLGAGIADTTDIPSGLDIIGTTRGATIWTIGAKELGSGTPATVAWPAPVVSFM